MEQQRNNACAEQQLGLNGVGGSAACGNAEFLREFRKTFAVGADGKDGNRQIAAFKLRGQLINAACGLNIYKRTEFVLPMSHNIGYNRLYNAVIVKIELDIRRKFFIGLFF